nr:MAG TPA: hypothetical protein [Caudoviricetes sp.]
MHALRISAFFASFYFAILAVIARSPVTWLLFRLSDNECNTILSSH